MGEPRLRRSMRMPAKWSWPNLMLLKRKHGTDTTTIAIPSLKMLQLKNLRPRKRQRRKLRQPRATLRVTRRLKRERKRKRERLAKKVRRRMARSPRRERLLRKERRKKVMLRLLKPLPLSEHFE